MIKLANTFDCKKQNTVFIVILHRLEKLDKS